MDVVISNTDHPHVDAGMPHPAHAAARSLAGAPQPSERRRLLSAPSRRSPITIVLAMCGTRGYRRRGRQREVTAAANRLGSDLSRRKKINELGIGNLLNMETGSSANTYVCLSTGLALRPHGLTYATQPTGLHYNHMTYSSRSQC
jgi:hypothetical protein